jgi:regulator of replication initiation timing
MDEELNALLARIEASKVAMERMMTKARAMVLEAEKIVKRSKDWKDAESKRAAKKKPK